MRRGWAAVLREENRDLRRKVVELEGERDTRLAVIKLLEGDVRTREERITELKRESARLARECDRLREMLEVAADRDRRLCAEVDDLRAENARIRGELIEKVPPC